MVEQVTIENKIALIKSQPCFAELTDQEAEQLADLLVEQEFVPDNIIVKQGTPVDSVFFIVSGTADVRYNFIEDNQRKFKSLAKLGENKTIGLSETGLYSLSGVRTATVVAETEMLLLKLSTAALNGFILANPRVGDLFHSKSTQE